jgi:hypothetical protein
MALVKSYDKRSTISKNSKEVYYSDFSKSFAIHPERMDVVRLVNENSITEALKNLILTQQGERFFNLDLGTNINSLLFENASPITMSALNNLIRTAISNFEPRVKIIEIRVEDSADENGLAVYLTFGIVNRTEPITIQFLLNRVR